MVRTVITGSGCYIPTLKILNKDFLLHTFFDEASKPLPTGNSSIIEKFQKITGISERRYAHDDIDASDMGYQAAMAAIADSKIDPETIDQIIVAHNFGNVSKGSIQSVAVPSLASLIKQQLGIKNPACTAADLLFGCPGWLQAVIHSHAFFKAGLAQRALIIGTETLSRVVDPSDRDGMIFSDGAGAVVLEAVKGDEQSAGIIDFSVQTHALNEAGYIYSGRAYDAGAIENIKYIKMKGRKVYEYALQHVPIAIKECLGKSGVSITDVKKIFIHQANEKMDEAIIARLYELYGISMPPKDVMPMCIGWLGNSSVATLPTLFDLVVKGEFEQHALDRGDIIVFASVGAGMNINAVSYRY